MIPFLELEPAYRELKDGIDAAIARVLASGYYILGPEVAAFEEKYARYVDAGHCVGVANGLEALLVALQAVGVRPGDEVVVPSHTFVATWLAVVQAGAVPVPVEPEADGFNIDPSRIEAAITPRTRAIVPVHLYGQPADLAPIMEIATRHGLKVVEDAAQAQGARVGGRRIGGHGDAVAWSFYPVKNLGALGDAGAVTTNDPDVARRLRMLRNYGSEVRYHHEIIGHNSRLDPIQAAVLSVKLDHLDAWNERRRRIAGIYLDGLAGRVPLPRLTPGTEPVWHLFVIRHSRRDRLQARLREAGVGTLIHYPVACHKQKAFAAMAVARERLPVAERLADEVLSLPIGPHLAEADARIVVERLAAVLEEPEFRTVAVEEAG